ncbi:L-type lectin-domain containing receptor kinase S.4 [Ananas comosus]|uniref:non-specific serine/threonine protein kinase n=1 Tax=Ananas comosus TaxID=4615 RepID=A0A199V409_ANACO|nr:L-type lectin-domain containing receptor kinase S.4 [Ananas comosus]
MSLNGIAEIEDSGILRLTNETTRLIGHAFYPTSLRFKNGTDGAVFSFSTAFAFAIVPEYPKLGGHGLAFTIATSKELAGALPSQYLGLLNASDVGNATNHVFAVEFDTVQDFEFGDINDNHVGIDLNNLASNASAAAAYYDGDGGRDEERPQPQERRHDPGMGRLRRRPQDAERMYAGFSASTGLLASSHYLMGWSFKMNGAAQSLDLSSLPSLPRSKKKNTTFILATSFSAFVLLVGAAAAGAYLFYKVKNADVVEPWELCYGPHRYSYKELKRATRGFRDKQLLGFGGFGKVYKGTLPGSGAGAGAEVAVKRVSHESRQGIREFVAEIATIGRLRHRNLVQLQGWCRRRGDLLLVYDYMPNGSLDKYLFCDGTEEDEETQKRGGVGGRRRRLLTWAERFRILRGVASALLYLHEEWEHVVVHRDVKASNVLLDADLNGRLGDFGLAKLYEHGANPSTTRVVGTLGYLAPEMTRTGRATTASDVFAFGALALEAACGRRPIDPKAAPEELILVEWVWERWAAGRWAETVDARLGGDYDRDEAMVAIKVGLMCSHPAAAARPTMREVVRYLDGGDAAEMPEIRSPPPPGYEGAGKGHEGFDDFVHSYPSSSFEKLSASASPVAVGVGERAAVGPMGYSPLAQSQPHSDVTA